MRDQDCRLHAISLLRCKLFCRFDQSNDFLLSSQKMSQKDKVEVDQNEVVSDFYAKETKQSP